MDDPPLAFPEKLGDLKPKITKEIEAGRYIFSIHVLRRMAERDVTPIEVMQVLTTGSHKRSHDVFDFEHHAWNYAVQGFTREQRELRIAVSLNESLGLVVITVVDDL